MSKMPRFWLLPAVCLALALTQLGRAEEIVEELVEEDVLPGPPFRTGDVIPFHDLERIKAYIPEPFWEWREYFFFEGQTLEIGEFYKEYAATEERRIATETFGGQAKVGRDNSLENFTVGMPF